MKDHFYYIDKLAQKFDGGSSNSQARSILLQVKAVVDLQPDDVFATWYDGKAKAVERVTFGALWEESGKIAFHLSGRLGLRHGDLAVLSYNFGLHFIAAFLGCLRAGVVAVLVYPPFPPLSKSLPKMNKVVQDCQPKVILTDALVDKLRKADQWNPLSATRKEWPDSVDFVVTDTLKADKRMDKDSMAAISVCGEELAFIQYTSGSTSDPKGVLVPHQVLAANIQAIHWRFRTFFDHQEYDSVPLVGCSWLPQYHDLGLVWAILSPLCGGWNIHLMSPIDFISNPVAWIQLLSDSKASFGAAPDFAYRLAARKFTQEKTKWKKHSFDLSSMRVFLNGAEPVQLDTKSLFEASFGQFQLPDCWIAPCYGLAEHVVAVCGVNECRTSKMRAEDTIPFVAVGSRHFIHPSIVIRIVDPSTNKELLDGQTGEIWVQGPCVAAGYHGKPELSKECFGRRLETVVKDRTGGGYFLRTGDLGFFQDDYLFVCGRIKDVIIINGVNYYPQDIEKAAQDASEAIRPGCVAAFSFKSAGNIIEDAFEVVLEIRKSHQNNIDDILQKVNLEIVQKIGFAATRMVAVEERAILKTTSGKIKRAATQQAIHEERLKILGTLEPALCKSSTNHPFLEAGADSMGPTGNIIELDENFDSHALVAGAGIVGLCYARDLASLGYRVTIVEISSSIGGVWATNNYPGLRLHSSGYSYRCLSLAPEWTKLHAPDEQYRPTRHEIVEYCHQLIDHPNIHLLLNTKCDVESVRETKESVLVMVGDKLHETMIFFASVGVSPRYTGAPAIPQDLCEQDRSAKNWVHSSSLKASQIQRCRDQKGRIVVLGSGKAAIDILQLFAAEDQAVLWAHRGHRMFMNRATLESAFFDDGFTNGQNMYRARHDAEKNGTGGESWCHLARKMGVFISCEGPLSSSKEPFSYGSCSKEELEHACSFRQFPLKALDCTNGTKLALSSTLASEEDIELDTHDLLIFCTGQLNRIWAFPRFSHSTFVSAPFASNGALSALVPLRLALARLRGESAFLSEAVQAIQSACDSVRRRSISDLACMHTELGAALFPCTNRILCKRYGFEEIALFREWVTLWHGQDLNVDAALEHLVNRKPRSSLLLNLAEKDKKKERILGEADDHSNGDTQITGAVDVLCQALHNTMLSLDIFQRSKASAKLGISMSDYKRFHSMLCPPVIARKALSTLTGKFLLLPHDYPRLVSSLSRYDTSNPALSDYYALVRDTRTGLTTLIEQTSCVRAEEVGYPENNMDTIVCDDDSLVVDKTVLDYIKAETGVEKVQLIRRFEFRFGGFARLSVAMLHFVSENGMLHIVEIFRRFSGPEVYNMSRPLSDAVSLFRSASLVSAIDPNHINAKLSMTDFVGLTNLVCKSFGVYDTSTLWDLLPFPNVEQRRIDSQGNKEVTPFDVSPSIRRIIAHSLHLDEEEIRDEVPLANVGLDSVTAYQALTMINAECGVELQAHELFQCQSVQEISSLVSQRSLVTSPGMAVAREDSLRRSKAQPSAPQSDPRVWFTARGMPPKLPNDECILVFCFHGITGSASASFGPFDQFLPGCVFPYFVKLPGIDDRASEPFPTDATNLVKAICNAISSFVRGRPFMLLGYSMGGTIAQMVSHTLSNEMNLTPVATILLCSPPHTDSPALRVRSTRFLVRSMGDAFEFFMARSGALLYSLRECARSVWGDSCQSAPEGSTIIVIGGQYDQYVPERLLRSHWRSSVVSNGFSLTIIPRAGHDMTFDPTFGHGRLFNSREAYIQCWAAVGANMLSVVSTKKRISQNFPPQNRLPAAIRYDLLSATSLERRLYFFNIVMEAEVFGRVPVEALAERLQATIMSNPQRWARFRSVFLRNISRWEPIENWSVGGHGHVVLGPLERPPPLRDSKLWFFEVIHNNNSDDDRTTIRFHFNHALGDGYALRSLCWDTLCDQEMTQTLSPPKLTPLMKAYRKMNDLKSKNKLRKYSPAIVDLQPSSGQKEPLVAMPLSIRKLKKVARRLAPGATVNDMLLFMVSHVKRRIGEEHSWLSCTFNQRAPDQMENMANASAFLPVYVKDGKLSSIQKYTRILKRSNAVTFKGHVEVVENPSAISGIAAKKGELVQGLSNVFGLPEDAVLLENYPCTSFRFWVNCPGYFFFVSNGDELSGCYLLDASVPLSRGQQVCETFAELAKEYDVVFGL